MRPWVSRRRSCSNPQAWMPLMVGLPNVGRGGVAAAAGMVPRDGSESSAMSVAIANRAARDLTGAPLIHPPDANAGGGQPSTPNLPPRVVVAYPGVVTHHGQGCQRDLRDILRPRPVDTTACGSVLSGGGIRRSRRAVGPPGPQELRGARLHRSNCAGLVYRRPGGPG